MFLQDVISPSATVLLKSYNNCRESHLVKLIWLAFCGLCMLVSVKQGTSVAVLAQNFVGTCFLYDTAFVPYATLYCFSIYFQSRKIYITLNAIVLWGVLICWSRTELLDQMLLLLIKTAFWSEHYTWIVSTAMCKKNASSTLTLIKVSFCNFSFLYPDTGIDKQ